MSEGMGKKSQNEEYRIRVADTRRADRFFAGWSPSGKRAELTRDPDQAMKYPTAEQAANQATVLMREPGVAYCSPELVPFL